MSIGENVYEQQQDGHNTPISSHADASSVYESGQDTDEERGSGAGNFLLKESLLPVAILRSQKSPSQCLCQGFQKKKAVILFSKRK